MFAFGIAVLTTLLPAIAALSIGKRDSIDVPAGQIYPDPTGVQRLRWASRMDLCITAIGSADSIENDSPVALAYCLGPDDENILLQNFSIPNAASNTGMTIHINDQLYYVGSGSSRDDGSLIRLVQQVEGVTNDLWTFTNGSFIEMVNNDATYSLTGKCMDVEKDDSEGSGGQMAALQLWDCTPDTDIQQYFAIYGGSA